MSDITSPDGVQPDPRDLRGAGPESSHSMPDDDVHAHTMDPAEAMMRHDPTNDLTAEPGQLRNAEPLRAPAETDVEGHRLMRNEPEGYRLGEARADGDDFQARFGDEDDVEGHSAPAEGEDGSERF